VCLPVCDDISDITRPNFSIFYAFCLWSWLGPSLVALLPVLWMTSSFHVMDPMARHVIRMPITRQRFYLDLRSPYKTNRKSYLANQMEPLMYCSDDRKCPKTCIGVFWLALDSTTATRLFPVYVGIRTAWQNCCINFSQSLLNDKHQDTHGWLRTCRAGQSLLNTIAFCLNA